MSTPAGDPFILRSVPPADNVVRWQALLPAYPEASFCFQPPWFIGAFRDDDEPVRALDLGRLIDKLLAREETAGRHGSPA